ncbi:MAG TPA: putative toxin-antitoxin system toxin component, PIN family [Lentisphaeria bacterium]|nr:putative toxin-antitoxin system toxin component, PIN family [Lentisphaeria bacterium]
MRIVIDTNVVASAIFFGGKPAKLLKLVLLRHPILAVATSEILEEYQTTIDYLLKKYNGKKLNFTMIPLFSAFEIIHSTSTIAVCRDPDDDKFISCAIDGQCCYIVSGDKDLLILNEYQNVQIITVSNFFRLLSQTEE